LTQPKTQLLAVTPENHLDKTWRQVENFHFATGLTLVSVVQAEASRAAGSLPLAFWKKQDSFELVAVTGLEPNQSLMVANNGQWLAGYVPAVLRAHPFWLVRMPGQKHPALCVDESTGLVEDAGKGQAFFDESGKGITPALKAMLQLLGQVEDSRVVTERAARLLASAQVLVPFSFKTRPSGPAQDLSALGELYMVDQARLNALDDESFTALRQHDALALAYAQLTSVHHLDALIRLSDALRKSGAAAQAAADASANALGGVFTGDSVIRFS
jgi:hypothetical protein